jgi:hypothetical protein
MSCGCTITRRTDLGMMSWPATDPRYYAIDFCPLHAAAEELRDCLQTIVDATPTVDPYTRSFARALLARLDGK